MFERYYILTMIKKQKKMILKKKPIVQERKACISKAYI